jgi:hypothetical protein
MLVRCRIITSEHKIAAVKINGQRTLKYQSFKLTVKAIITKGKTAAAMIEPSEMYRQMRTIIAQRTKTIRPGIV